MGLYPDKEDKDTPKQVELQNFIVQIYAGENMSWAVDKLGETFAWGENKHNQLLLNSVSNNAQTNIDYPAKIAFPGYFHRPNNLNILSNNTGGITMYESRRPVKSVASETQQDLDKMKIENYKLKITIKELEKKLAKWGAQDQSGVDQENEIKKSTQNDKVIQNL